MLAIRKDLGNKGSRLAPLDMLRAHITDIHLIEKGNAPP